MGIRRGIRQQPTLLADRFEILEPLGSGGFGDVFEALDRRWDERVAIKSLRAFDSDSLLRFKREFRCLQEVSHPNLVHLRELLSTTDGWFFTMELIRGQDFLSHVRPLLARKEERLGSRTRYLDLPRLRHALAQLVEGLCALHQSGQAHCDIKPSNILVEDSGRLVLLDFGLLSQLAQAGDESDDMLIGTPEYMSPEQVRGDPITPATDWYAVGTLLFQALTGRLPFGGARLAALQLKLEGPALHPKDLNPQAPEDLANLCHSLLDMDPAARPTGDMLRWRFGASNDNQPIRTTVSRNTAPCFVGRERELDTLGSRMQEALAASARCVFICGDSGMGKTSLAENFSLQMKQRHAVAVLKARCYERETVPFKAFDGIMDDLSALIEGLPDATQQRLLTGTCAPLAQAFPVFDAFVALGDPSSTHIALEPHVQRLEAFAALRTLLCRLGQERPLLVLIDDLQWADRDSLQLLRELLEGDAQPRCMVVTTGRPLEQWGRELQHDMHTLLAQPGTSALSLSGLDDSASRQMVESLMGPSSAAPDTEELLRETQGNPLFIWELMREPLPSTSGRTLRETLLERIADLEDGTRAVLDLLAIAGRPLDHRVLAQALKLELSQLDRRLAELRIARLGRSAGQDQEECYHDLVRWSALTPLNENTRREHCRALAQVLSRDPQTDHEQLADLWDEAGEPLRAARLCVDAARLSERALAFHRSAHLYLRALKTPEAFPPGEVPRLRARYAEALSCAGFGHEAAKLFLELAEQQQGGERTRLLRKAARLLLQSGDVQRGLSLTDTLLSEVGLNRPQTPATAVARVLWERARLSRTALKPPERSRPLAAQAAERLDALWAVGLPLSCVDLLGGTALQAQYARLAVHSGDRVHAARALTGVALLLTTTERPPHARLAEVLTHSRSLADREEDPYLRGLHELAMGFAALTQAHYGQALTRLSSSETIFRLRCVDVAWEITIARAMLLNAHWHLGNLSRHSELSREWLRDAYNRKDHYARAQFHVMGMAYFNHLTLNDPEAALLSLEESLKDWSTRQFQLPQWTQYIGRQLVGLYRGDGSAHTTVHQTEPELRRSRLLHAPYLSLLTHADAAWARLEHATRCQGLERERELEKVLQHAAEVRKTRWPLSDTLTRQITGQALLLQGKRAEAVTQLQAAYRVFLAHGSLYTHPTGYLLGTLLPGATGESLRESALQWCTEQDVAKPIAMLSIFAPALRTQNQ